MFSHHTEFPFYNPQIYQTLKIIRANITVLTDFIWNVRHSRRTDRNGYNRSIYSRLSLTSCFNKFVGSSYRKNRIQISIFYIIFNA